MSARERLLAMGQLHEVLIDILEELERIADLMEPLFVRLECESRTGRQHKEKTDDNVDDAEERYDSPRLSATHHDVRL